MGFNQNETVGGILSEMDVLIRAEYLKERILQTVNKIAENKEKYETAQESGERADFPYMNMLFEGSLGTGKTTVANIMARLLFAKGIVTNPYPIIIKPSDFTSIYVGDLAEQLGKVLDKDRGGVVVIDEFYNFNRPHSSGNLADEAISVIMDRIDKYRDSMCLILCGHKNAMDKILNFNAGAIRRFPHVIEFKPYSDEDLLEIFKRCLQEDEIEIEDDALVLVEKVIHAENKPGRTIWKRRLY